MTERREPGVHSALMFSLKLVAFVSDWNNLSNDIIEVTTLNSFKHAIPDIDFNLHSQSLFLVAGPVEQFSMCGGLSTSFEVQREEGWGLWTLKMVYLWPTQYVLIQLQLINHFL